MDRERLLDISGRSRQRQMELADELGISDWPQPAGGCCYLTDESFARKFFDVLDAREARGRGAPPRAGRRRAPLHRAPLPALAAREAHRGPERGRERAPRAPRRGARARSRRRTCSARSRSSRASRPGRSGMLAARIVARYGKGKDAPRVAVEWREGDLVETLRGRAGARRGADRGAADLSGSRGARRPGRAPLAPGAARADHRTPHPVTLERGRLASSCSRAARPVAGREPIAIVGPAAFRPQSETSRREVTRMAPEAHLLLRRRQGRGQQGHEGPARRQGRRARRDVQHRHPGPAGLHHHDRGLQRVLPRRQEAAEGARRRSSAPR